MISDTHGLVRPQVHDVLEGVEFILHAGDVGGPDVLHELETIAPVQAVYGNMDAPGQPPLVTDIEREVGGLRVHVSHGHELGSPTPERLVARYDADVIIYGHTHRPLVVRVQDAGGRERLVVNPGAAGPARFDITPSVARLVVSGGKASVEVVELR